MARPQKAPADKKRCLVQFRTTEEEKTQFEKLACEAGLTVSDFIKKLVIKRQPQKKRATPDRAILIKGLAELGKIGSNINQIAKEINTQRKEGVTPNVPMYVIETALQGIAMLTHHLRKELEHGHQG